MIPNLNFPKLITILFCATIWIKEWHYLTAELHHVAPSPSLSKAEVPTFDLAIIGAGAGGSSSAFWVSKALEGSDLRLSIDVYERSSHIGGRSFCTQLPKTAAYPYYVPVELGAQFFGEQERNLVRASKEFALPLHENTRMDRIHVWNGRKLSRLSTSLWDLLDFVLHYGFPPFVFGSINERAEEVANRFSKVYKQGFSVWRDSAEFVERLNLTELLASSVSDYFLESGVSNALVKDFFVPMGSEPGGQYANSTHALQSIFRMALSTSGPQYHILGGTGRIFQQFAARSGASLLLNTTVGSIDRVANATRWRVNTGSGAKEYDAVIFAAPYHQAQIRLPSHLSSQIPFVSHQAVHITIIGTPSLSVNRSFLGLPHGTEDVRYIFSSSTGHANQVPFTRLAYEREAMPGVWVVRITSSSSLSADWLLGAFNGRVNWVHRHTWDVPVLAPTTNLPPIKLDEGFYYLSGFESMVSSMETQIVASQNLVNLLLHNHFHQGICGTAQHHHSGGDFVAGWDC